MPSQDKPLFSTPWTKLSFGALFILGVSIRLWFWAHPIEQLVAWTLTDDAFYYFKVGENIARGLGSTFDGSNPTNGYHPLWMLFTILSFSLFPNRIAAIRALLLTEVFLDAGAGLVLAYLAYRLSKGPTYPLLIGALWMLNYRVIAVSLNGMETALSSLLINSSLLSSLMVLTKKDEPKRWVIFGLIGGLAILARTDNAILLVLLFLILALNHPNLKLLLGAIILCGLLNLPWLIWNYINFHSPLQTSATAITFAIRRTLESRYGIPIPLPTLVAYLGSLWINTVKRLYLFTGLPFAAKAFISALWIMGGLLLLITGNGLGAFAITARRPASRRNPFLGVSGFWAGVVLWPILFTTIHVLGRWYFRPHYHASLAASEILVFGSFLHSLLTRGRWGKIWASFFIPLTITATLQFCKSDLLRHQATMLNAAHWLNAHSRDCEVVGSFNAGILGFYYEEGKVINLDGVINNRASQAIKEGVLYQYIEHEGICCLADLEEKPGEILKLPQWGGPLPSPVTELVRLPLSKKTYVIYRLHKCTLGE